MRVSELLKATQLHINVYKGNEKTGFYLYWSTNPYIPKPMRKEDVENLVIEKFEMEMMRDEFHLRIIARDENANEKIQREIPWFRMDNIANACLDGMYEAEPYEADKFCLEELDFTEYEQKYFNVPRTEKHEFTCPDCPYYHADEEDEPERCHYQGEDRYAPCAYEEPEEVDWTEYE